MEPFLHFNFLKLCKLIQRFCASVKLKIKAWWWLQGFKSSSVSQLFNTDSPFVCPLLDIYSDSLQRTMDPQARVLCVKVAGLYQQFIAECGYLDGDLWAPSSCKRFKWTLIYEGKTDCSWCIDPTRCFKKESSTLLEVVWLQRKNKNSCTIRIWLSLTASQICALKCNWFWINNVDS